MKTLFSILLIASVVVGCTHPETKLGIQIKNDEGYTSTINELDSIQMVSTKKCNIWIKGRKMTITGNHITPYTY